MESTILIDNIEVAYRTKGEGKPLFVLHGWGSSYRSWVAVQDKIAAEGFRVIVPDLPGFGKTPAPVLAWSVSDYREFVQKFIHACLSGRQALLPNSDEKFFLLGHSFGGRVAVSYAALYGEELQGLILCDAAGMFRHNKEKVAAFLFLTEIGNVIFAVPFLGFARNTVRDVWYRLTHERDYYRATGTMRETFKKVIEENLAGNLPSIHTPTLILWGEKDEATPLQDAHIIHGGIQGSTLEVLKGAGHPINLERPDEVAHFAVNFMSRS